LCSISRGNTRKLPLLRLKLEGVTGQGSWKMVLKPNLALTRAVSNVLLVPPPIQSKVLKKLSNSFGLPDVSLEVVT
jgi:hypothetical protein